MITPSKKDDYPFLADWFAISLRWLMLLGIPSTLLMAGMLNRNVIIVILFATIWNIFSSMLTLVNRRIPAHRLIHVTIDVLLTALFFVFGGGLSGPLIWISLMALFTSAIYFEWRGSLIMAAVISVLQTAYVLIFTPLSNLVVQQMFMLVGFNLAGGLIFGLLSRKLIVIFRRRYQGLLVKRQDDEQRAERRERDRMRTVINLIETLSSSLDYQTVIETALDTSIQAVKIGASDAELMISAALLFEDNDLKVQAGRGLTGNDLRQTFPAKAGALKEVLNTGKAKMITAPSHDPELGQILALQKCRQALLLPLHRGLNAYGVMLFAHPTEHFFNSDRCETLEVLSHQAVVAIQNALLFQDIAKEKERIVATREEERKKLARDLHDGPTQSVSAIAMSIAIARKLMEKDIGEASDELARIETLARRTTQEIRTMLFTLRPLVLESDGLAPALQAMADKMRETYQQNVIVEVDPETSGLIESAKQTVVFYLAEEAVNNARKYAQASEIRVKLRFVSRDKSLGLLEINDDGVGFDVEEVNNHYEQRGSLGMVNLRERSDLINGVLHIDSAPGKGTRVQVAIPFTQEAADRLQRGLTR
jgi:signal transduction histidine kinase